LTMGGCSQQHGSSIQKDSERGADAMRPLAEPLRAAMSQQIPAPHRTLAYSHAS